MPNQPSKMSISPLPQDFASQPKAGEQLNNSPTPIVDDHRDAPEDDEPILRAKPTGTPVVGLGASAGGIEALTRFFAATAADTGLAFVVVVHLDPTKESQLASVLKLHTTMPVAGIEDGMVVAQNNVYVIAPNRDLTLDGETLRLREPIQPRGQRHPVDVLFKSLAEQRHERTAAIILSGTGTNGSQGLKEIKGAGGLILVQNPLEAQFGGMPRSAINAGLADHVLSVTDMPGTLLRYFEHRSVAVPEGVEHHGPDEQPLLVQLLGLLRAHSGQEFRSYKPATRLRRIHRRMSLKSLADLGSYLDLLRADASEIQAFDVLDENLNAARAGVYPGASVETLPPERIRRFFDKLDGSYQVKRMLRDLVVFAQQDLLREPPFSRMDLITCRNMLIYIDPEAQRRALALFHFALREGGRLVLGSAETIGRADDLFQTVSMPRQSSKRVGNPWSS